MDRAEGPEEGEQRRPDGEQVLVDLSGSIDNGEKIGAGTSVLVTSSRRSFTPHACEG